MPQTARYQCARHCRAGGSASSRVGGGAEWAELEGLIACVPYNLSPSQFWSVRFSMDQNSTQHEKRLQHATAAWTSVMAALGGSPPAQHPPPSSVSLQDERQLAEHATKLLSLPLLCIGKLPGRLRDATIAQIVRMYADCAAHLKHHVEGLATDRRQLLRDVITWCTWALSQSLCSQTVTHGTDSPQASTCGDVALRGENEMGLALEGARDLMAHFGVGALDWANLLAAEGANALAHHLPECDAASLSAIALESLPGMGHPTAMPAIEELVAHCCRTALQQQEQQPLPHNRSRVGDSAGSLLDNMLPAQFQAALLAEPADADGTCSRRPFDLLRSKTKLLWWRLQQKTLSAQVIQLARQACAQYPYGSATHMIIGAWLQGGRLSEPVRLESDMSLLDAQCQARPSWMQRVQAIAECSVSWRPLFSHAVDVLLQLLRDTGTSPNDSQRTGQSELAFCALQDIPRSLMYSMRSALRLLQACTNQTNSGHCREVFVGGR